MATIRKRDPYQWQAIIRKRGFPNQVKTFTSKADAQAWPGQFESEMVRGVYVSIGEAERTTLADALERYWNEVASIKRHPHQERQRIDRLKRHPLAQNYLAALRGSDFAKYRDRRRLEGRAENTIRLELALIAHLFEVARKEWGMEGLANPLKNIKKPSGSVEREHRLKAGEYEQISKALAQSENPWILPLFDMAIETALRQGMLLALRWEWINLSSRVMNVPREFRTSGNKGVPAALPLSSKAIEILSTLPRSIDGIVFPTTANALRCVWKRTLPLTCSPI
ncbi:tyrosine-type recombinase/integrase [Herbaspirillum rubrisubalbicans]|uniref:tyrosine-type recombinase/integrase n=1 Tax=Herbaspirillum rubrisubalbicans TaxID=80842 RepID=UPI0011BF6FFF|nr:tyrosine-type recombinase/integrase [Herbaspirillum rubrisubalbicans]